MKPTIRLFVLLCVVHGLAVGLTFIAAHAGHWMGATALFTASLLLLDRIVRMLRALQCERSSRSTL